MNQPSRRNVLQFLGAGALGAAFGPALVSCSTGGGSTASGSTMAPWPTFAKAVGPKPDLPSTLGPNGIDGFFKYPTDLAQSVTKTVGDGSKVSSLILSYSPPPNPAPQNIRWAAINKATNTDIQLNIVPASEYTQKLSTITASNDLPDTMLIPASPPMPRAKQFVQAKCQDLTEYLSGDNILEYPNLAALPRYAWEAMGRIDGGIYGIPNPRARTGGVLHVNRDLFDAAGAPEPWTKEQFTKSLRDVTKGPTYGLGAFAGWDFSLDTLAGPLGAPNLWKEENGAFTATRQTPEFRAGLELARDLYKEGLYHPSSNTASQNDMMNQYYAKNVAAVPGNFMNYANGTFFDRVGGNFRTDVGVPFGTEMTSWLGSGIFGYTVFKKADPERIKMLLRLCDYLAAPYGTVEWELVQKGVEGQHFKRTPDGLEMTKLASSENANTTPVSYIAKAQEFIQVPNKPEATKRAFEVYEKIVSNGTANPALGLDSETMEREESDILRKLSDVSNAIVTGRSDISAWDSAIEVYNTGSGKKIREELAKAYAEQKTA
ncbi:extracellular solute-binding protein [Arthrobacter sp. YN]|uniref:extracellular solute-binding protein n=1 Tax=Arthrobacter sp. YN TaxID=2020486 RepID=UPI000B621C13|nr:extracellular solute-binding protein [Arthrobacter sp. YN]ASN22037.1 hypothetical protein CGK93_22000 [Arthrobacter sp. YN]